MSPARLLWISLALASAACSHETPSRPAPSAIGGATVPASAPATARRVPIRVTEGYEPDTVTASLGQPLVLVFTRTTDETCGTSLEIPSLHIVRPLPLGKPVEIALVPDRKGTVAFTCGMHMLHGEIHVE